LQPPPAAATLMSTLSRYSMKRGSDADRQTK